MKYLKGDTRLVVLSLCFALFSVGCKLAIPYFIGLSIDSIRSGNPEIAKYLFWILGLLAVGAASRFFFDYFVGMVGEIIVKKMRSSLYKKMVDLPISFFDGRKEGDLLLLFTNDIDTVRTGIVSGGAALFEGSVMILMTIVLMFVLNWLLALMVVFLTPISLIVSRLISKANSKSFRAQNARLAELTGLGNESIANLETIQSYGMGEIREAVFAKKADEVRKAQFKAFFASTWINPSSRLVNNLIYGSLVMVGAFLLIEQPSFLHQTFTVGYLSSFLTYAYQYMTPFNEVADASGDILYALSSLGRFEDVMKESEDIDEGKAPIGEKVESLVGNDIHFGYTANQEVLKGIDFKIKKGQIVALVGTTGCGKTTLINLLMRFYDPRSGEIRVNDTKLPEVSKKELRSHFGMVLQQTVMFHGTIGDNIRFGVDTCSQQEMENAAKAAKADTLIAKLPQGYDTPIESVVLSSGERQLICLARVLLCAPEVVLLDEATSNIDLRTEAALSGGFDTLLKGKTAVVVAHRLSTIVDADTILVMDQGKIVEHGNFATLMKQNGFFARLYHSQFE